MRVTVLSENTEGSAGLVPEHGLSFYLETGKHRILMDTGASDLFAVNAAKLGVDLKNVDTAFLSHGHYDHGGGLETFLSINEKANVYVQDTAFRPYYSVHNGVVKYIGLPEELRKNGRFYDPGRFCRIDEELSVFSDIACGYPFPSANLALKRKEGEVLRQDDFCHEQCLAVHSEGKDILFSGCAHHGILNILDTFRKLYGKDPDCVFSGFHMLKKESEGYDEEDVRSFQETAELLKQTGTIYYTCHCTGLYAYEIMCEIMGDRLRYAHCGDVITIDGKRIR